MAVRAAHADWRSAAYLQKPQPTGRPLSKPLLTRKGSVILHIDLALECRVINMSSLPNRFTLFLAYFMMS
eukprot:2011333-Amphidinium_carterae.1